MIPFEQLGAPYDIAVVGLLECVRRDSAASCAPRTRDGSVAVSGSVTIPDMEQWWRMPARA